MVGQRVAVRHVLAVVWMVWLLGFGMPHPYLTHPVVGLISRVRRGGRESPSLMDLIPGMMVITRLVVLLHVAVFSARNP